MVPFADMERLLPICDWGNWIFPFDDLFDNGDAREDVVRAEEIMDHMYLTFGDDSTSGHVVDRRAIEMLDIVRYHESIYKAIEALSSEGRRPTRGAPLGKSFC
jgi:hypothetical protein